MSFESTSFSQANSQNYGTTREEMSDSQCVKIINKTFVAGRVSRPAWLTDAKIIAHMRSGASQEICKNLLDQQHNFGNVVQMLYFETQGGPTRRMTSKPGDISITIPALDGSCIICTFMNLWKKVETFYTHLSNDEKLKNEVLFQALFDKLEKARPLFLMIGNSGFTDLALNDAAKTAVFQVQTLSSGEAVIFPGGYTDHAIVYEVKKEFDESYSLTVFNSGEGVETYHVEKRGKHSNARVMNIDVASLNEPFFRKLFSFLKQTPSDAIEAVYSHLQSLGKIESDESYHYGQGNIGSCAYQGLHIWFKRQIGKKLYHQIRIYTLQELLSDCSSFFSGQLRDAAGAMTVAIDWRVIEIQRADVDTIRACAKRCLQTTRRALLIHSAVELANKIPDKEVRIRALLSMASEPEIRQTILSEQDKCFVLLKGSEELLESSSAYSDEAAIIRDAVVKEASRQIDAPRGKVTSLKELAKVFFVKGYASEGNRLMDQAVEIAAMDFPTFSEGKPVLEELVQTFADFGEMAKARDTYQRIPE